MFARFDTLVKNTINLECKRKSETAAGSFQKVLDYWKGQPFNKAKAGARVAHFLVFEFPARKQEK